MSNMVGFYATERELGEGTHVIAIDEVVALSFTESETKMAVFNKLPMLYITLRSGRQYSFTFEDDEELEKVVEIFTRPQPQQLNEGYGYDPNMIQEGAVDL